MPGSWPRGLCGSLLLGRWDYTPGGPGPDFGPELETLTDLTNWANLSKKGVPETVLLSKGSISRCHWS